MKEDILHNLDLINNRIKIACEQSGRNSNEVKLLLATKTVSAERIKVALEQGQTLIAENVPASWPNVGAFAAGLVSFAWPGIGIVIVFWSNDWLEFFYKILLEHG